MVLVDTDEICSAIKDIFEDTRSITEPSGALGVAGAKKYAAEKGIEGKNLVAIASGANMNFDRLRLVIVPPASDVFCAPFSRLCEGNATLGVGHSQTIAQKVGIEHVVSQTLLFSWK